VNFEGKNPLKRVVSLKKILFDQILKTWGISALLIYLLTKLNFCDIKEKETHKSEFDRK